MFYQHRFTERARKAMTLAQEAAASVGIKIPTLCYLNLHELGCKNAPGVCRICVVEVEGRKILAPACKTVCTEGMVVRTHTPRVINARQTILELLLSDPPNECLTCSKNGYCSLQTMAKDLGIREAKYKGETTKPMMDLSPSVVRNMEKCILCRRCETVCNQVQTVGALSVVGRGFTSVLCTAFNDPILTTNCVNCGQCVAVCPTSALSENSNIREVMQALADPGKTVVVQTAPAVRVALGQDFGLEGRSVTGKMTTALRRLGFDYVFDTDFAADLPIMEEAHEFIERNPATKALKSAVTYNPRWMKGIVGIVASRLIETYYRPTVVLTMSNGFVTGSARSVPGFDLYQAIESCSDLLENFGGHMYAAGLTMRPENVDEFTRRFNAYVEENIDPQMLMPQVDIDSELLFSDITPAFRKDLNRFQPFGPGNTAPVFATYGVSNHGDAKLVGVECEHLRMDLMQRQKPNTTIQTIAFQQPTHYEWIRAGHPIDVCYQIVENHYRGSVSVQLRIKDIKPLRSKQ